MTRARFWITQFIWLFAVGISGVAGAENDAQLIPFVLLFAFVLTGFVNRWGAKLGDAQAQNVMGYNGHIVARVMATAFIWVIYMGGTVAAVSDMGGWGVLMALVMMIPAMAFTGLIWLWERLSGISTDQLQSVMKETQKRKRTSVDSLLGNLSDEDVRHLRERLQDVNTPYETDYARGLADDGELVYHQGK